MTRTCVITGGLRRLHSTYPDGTEIVEEFNITTHELQSRKVKKLTKIGEGKWEWEVGEPIKTEAEIRQSNENVIDYLADIYKKRHFKRVPMENQEFALPAFYL